MRPSLSAAILTLALMLPACEKAPEMAEAQEKAVPAAPQVSWRMSSTYPSTLLILGTMGKRITSEVAAVSGGAIDIRFFEPGVLSPPFETFDAVSYGAIEAGWSTSGYWAGKVPALQLFSSVPFGPSAPEYLAWYDYGGGRELFEKLYHRHNIHGLICGMSPPEASGWFKEEIRTLADFKGKKIRFFGLGAKVLEEVGASPQLLAGGEIYQALELGTIDGTEYSVPAVDEKMGLQEIAKHYYFPGWHQQSTFFELIINLDVWNGLDTTQKAQVEAACSANIRYGLSEGEALQSAALERIRAAGVTLHTWSPDVLAGLEAAWDKVAADLAATDPAFAEVWASMTAFRASYKEWAERGYLKD